MKITIIAGSPRKESVTRRIALHLQTRLRADAHEVTIADLGGSNIGDFGQVWQNEGDVPAHFASSYAAIMQSEAVIIVSPEYNGTYTGALKNMLDHLPKNALMRKAFGIVTGSPGGLGGMRAAVQLQTLGIGASGIVCPSMLIVPTMSSKFDADGTLIDAAFQRAVDGFVGDYVWLATQLVK